MAVYVTTEKRFEEDLESFFLSCEEGYVKGADTYVTKFGMSSSSIEEVQ